VQEDKVAGPLKILIWVAALLHLSACTAGITLAPPPNLYLEGRNYPADQVAASLRTSTPDIFFVTDRVPDEGSYGSDRSNSMAFGAATVEFGRDLVWDQVIERTHTDSGRRFSGLAVTDISEVVRFSDTPLPYERRDGRLRHLDSATTLYDRQKSQFQDAIRNKIRETGNRRVLIYVHGFNNDFEDSVTALANLWHFSGRETIPVAFTWPSGNGFGPLGYFRDRDSGTFSVHHAKEFLRMIIEMPEVEQIDLVAHSRGTDVITTALRELMIFARGQGQHPKLALKTGTLIMAAPDLSIEIVRQRLQAERFSEAFEQINLYNNPADFALQLSGYLTGSKRLGSLKDEDFLPREVAQLQKQALVHFIRVENIRGAGHSYFRNNPAVLSDIVLALRTRAFPGGTLRPLEQHDSGVWLLHPNYPLDRLPDLEVLLPGDR
jgi:esterase/lipase superfamily enzyme